MSDPAASPAPAAPVPAPLEGALGRLAALLRDEGKSRVPLPRLEALFDAAHVQDRAQEADPRRALAGALQALHARGCICLPPVKAKDRWDTERAPSLPRSVNVLRPMPAPEEADAEVVTSPSSAALHPLLAHARDVAGRPARLPAGLPELDRWLRANPGPFAAASLVPTQERSYEIFGHEKRLQEFLETRFAREGGFTAALVGAYRVIEPFVHTLVDPASAWALACENAASYESVTRAAKALPAMGGRGPAAVIYGAGNAFTLSCEGFSAALPRVTRLVYWGDVDAAGFEIALSVQERLAPLAVEPWVAAYARLLERPPQQGGISKAIPPSRARVLAAWLPPPLRPRATALLEQGARVPQEALGREALAQLL